VLTRRTLDATQRCLCDRLELNTLVCHVERTDKPMSHDTTTFHSCVLTFSYISCQLIYIDILYKFVYSLFDRKRPSRVFALIVIVPVDQLN